MQAVNTSSSRKPVSKESYALCRSFRGTISDASCLLNEVEFSDTELASVGLSKRNIERIRQMVSLLNKLNNRTKK